MLQLLTWMDDAEAIISPGGVGFDINCSVRLIRTNLTEKDDIPVGFGVGLGTVLEKVQI